jgi:hypothetical protein
MHSKEKPREEPGSPRGCGMRYRAASAIAERYCVLKILIPPLGYAAPPPVALGAVNGE